MNIIKNFSNKISSSRKISFELFKMSSMLPKFTLNDFAWELVQNALIYNDLYAKYAKKMGTSFGTQEVGFITLVEMFKEMEKHYVENAERYLIEIGVTDPKSRPFGAGKRTETGSEEFFKGLEEYMEKNPKTFVFGEKVLTTVFLEIRYDEKVLSHNLFGNHSGTTFLVNHEAKFPISLAFPLASFQRFKHNNFFDSSATDFKTIQENCSVRTGHGTGKKEGIYNLNDFRSQFLLPTLKKDNNTI